MGLIYLDACLLIYAYENHLTLGPAVWALLRKQAPESFAISPLTKMECLVRPIKTGNLVLQNFYKESFASFSQLPMTESVYLLAAQLRGRFNLKTADALHLACAQHHRCDALWTNDERLTAAGHGLARNALKPAQG